MDEIEFKPVMQDIFIINIINCLSLFFRIELHDEIISITFNSKLVFFVMFVSYANPSVEME